MFLACCALFGPRAAAFEEETSEQRSARLAAMNPTEKEELRSKKSRFDKLSAEERARLRNLHTQICQQPDAVKLHAVMKRYSDWLRLLPIEQRYELAGMAPPRRLEQIKKLVEQQERQRFQELFHRKLSPQDLDAIKKWLFAIVTRDVKSLLLQLPPDARERLGGEPEARAVLAEFSRMRREQAGKKDFRPLDYLDVSDADVAQLATQLSAEAKGTLAEATNKNDRVALVRGWAFAATLTGRLPRVSDEELRRYLAERVDARTRDHLENLPRDEMFSQLRRLYYTEQFRARWPRWGGPGSPGPPPGPGGWQPGGNSRGAPPPPPPGGAQRRGKSDE